MKGKLHGKLTLRYGHGLPLHSVLTVDLGGEMRS